MQKINTVLLVVLLLAVGYLLVDKFSNSTPEANEMDSVEIIDEQDSETMDALPGEGQIAYVNLDTLNASFAFLIDKLELMQSEQLRQQKNFERQARKVEERYLALQEDAYKMTQDQLVAAQTEMENAQVQLQSSQERITKELVALETSIQSELDERIDVELRNINDKYGFDYILAKAAGSGVLQAKGEFDITDEVLTGLNEAYEAEKGAE